MRLAGSSNDVFRKVNDKPGFLEKVKAKQAFNSALRRKIVTDYFHILDFNSEGSKFWNDNYGNIFNTAACGYFNPALGMQGATTDSYSGFNWNHCISSSGVKSHFKGELCFAVRYFSMTDNDTLFRVKLELRHKLKGSSVALRKGIFRILYQKLFCLRRLEQEPINVVPARAVRNEPSRDRSGAGCINFVYSDKKPLPMNPVFYILDFLDFHNICLTNKYISANCRSQVDSMGVGNRSVNGGQN